ncbi:hypothetical protein CDD83_3517 [Cordyceps sp. RAO-2017]|nr:hypothetical protein CDD83_3517 [Cordyceps sp. RAO-2017]
MVGAAAHLACLVALGAVVPALAASEFFVPGPPPYPRWKAGDVHQIRYRTTYTEYTIALWQQFEGAAKLGPIVFRTSLR